MAPSRAARQAAARAAAAATQAAIRDATAAAVADVYGEVEERLLALLARRAAAGRAGGYDRWALRKAEESAAFAAAARAGITNLDEVANRLILEGLGAAYQAAAESTAAEAATVLGEEAALQVAGTPHAVELLAGEAAGRLDAAHVGMLRQAADTWQRLQFQVAAHYTSGTMTLPQAVQYALDQVAQRGLTRFVDTAGRTWGMQEYAEMVTRTGCARAQVNGTLDRLAAMGHDLVIVSDSPEECPLCRPWEGKVLSRSGQPQAGESYPSVEEATAAGLFHPNCTHGLGAWVPGLSRPMRQGLANPEGYQDRQRERALERRIRSWKRRQAVALDPIADARARQGLANARADYRTFVGRTGRLEQPWRRRLLGVTAQPPTAV